MKKQIFTFLLLSLATCHVKAANPVPALADPVITSSALIAGTALLGTLVHTANWPAENKNRPSIWTVLGESAHIPGRDTLRLASIGLGLTAISLLCPTTRSTMTTAGTLGGACLIGQFFCSTDQERNPVNIDTTIKITVGAFALNFFAEILLNKH